mgnify:CR=1 FL=1
MRILHLFLALATCLQADVRKDVEDFLEQHCYDCHDDIDNEGGLNLLDLKFDPADPKNRAHWEAVFQRVEAGEMPPKKKKRPEAGALAAFLRKLEAPLIEADRKELAKTGRVHTRRLTAEEYENSLHDLLGIDIPLAGELTADSEEGFTTNAETQQISHFHLDNYLRVGAKALDEAFDRALKGDKQFRREYSAKDVTSPGRGNNRGPQFWKGKAISWHARLQFAGRITRTRVPDNGWYRITIHNLDAVNPGADGYLWGTLQTGSGFSNEPLLYPLGTVEATTKPKTQVYEGWMQKDHMLVFKPNEANLKSLPSKGGSFSFGGRDFEKMGITGFRFEKITIERIYPVAGRQLVRTHLFADLDPAKVKENPRPALSRLIRRFASRAFRRPVTKEQAAPYEELAFGQLKAGKSFPMALRSAYHAVLCSPNFLTFVEKPGFLDDYAIATRLSFLLWKTLPDGQLRKLADEGRLREPEVLHRQIARLLAHEKSSRFIGDFTDQWLDLRDIDATQPDPRRFRNFDLPLQQSLKAETQAFVAGLIAENRPVTQLLKSDMGFLNTRLRDHYKLKEITVKPGEGLQKVKLEPVHRSGLLTQASILKVTADGSVTSPVLRGIWVNERILGRHIPPPPESVPAIEPDIRGAVSIRDQLAKHTNQTSCASCHDKIDPSGFSLESYDPIGQYRVAYGNKKNSAKVDPSGVTPDGVQFKAFNSWRAVYLKRPEVLTHAFARQLLSYGVGGELRFSDRPHLERIVAQTSKKRFGLRNIIHAALTSEIFLNK